MREGGSEGGRKGGRKKGTYYQNVLRSFLNLVYFCCNLQLNILYSTFKYGI